ncbi:uncharacterized protein LOC117173818 [Belonocnema kinseyi]|uniref:uncharacterized protein LOC117173818 n=1 Tax=Belonocnema kinseyi TaxID=2817044 RepID=UPI00143D56CC|nr:uncharacterized protein LOC117173818 [Belonocnema kinseyi]
METTGLETTPGTGKIQIPVYIVDIFSNDQKEALAKKIGNGRYLGKVFPLSSWLSRFLMRHSTLLLRRPQATSLSRATAFNQHNVSMFFTKLKDEIERFAIESANIWNMDESDLTTVRKPVAVLAQRGIRNLGSATSAERGVLVTLALAVSAGGVCLPPFYVFPRKKFRGDVLAAAGFGADGATNPSGLMQGEQFLKFLNHFKKYARTAPDSKTLLILDNRESHMTIAALDFCKDNEIIVLSLPPYTSHELQPIDRGVFGRIKTFYNAALEHSNDGAEKENNDEENNDPEVSAKAALEHVRPFPKAPPREPTNRGRKRRKSALLMDEDEMEALRAE